MNKIKNIVYAASAATLALAPSLALASPWSVGFSNASAAGTPDGTIYGIIGGIMNWLLAILGFLGIIGFVLSGILYLTAAGDEGQIDRAKEALTYSIIGVIVALLGFVIIKAVDTMLNAGGGF